MLKKFFIKLVNFIYPHIIQRYVLRFFFLSFFTCILIAISLFLVVDMFDRSKVLIRENSSFGLALQYFLYKIPLVLHLMTPVAILISTLVSVGRLSQLSEITAMRACGLSVFNLARPLLFIGLLTFGIMFFLGETLVPWSMDQVERIYNLDIKKKDAKGRLSRHNFWYRDQDKTFNIGYYNSSNQTLEKLSIWEFDAEDKLKKKTDAQKVIWDKKQQIWIMQDVVESIFVAYNIKEIKQYPNLPLKLKEKPEDFYDLQKLPETMSYHELGRYIYKLESEGVPTTEYKVQRIAKISFPLINILVILIAFPFALIPARSGSLTLSFLAGVSIGFGYYFIHAISLALGGAELLPLYVSAWSADVLFFIIGSYLTLRSDYA
ncbi:MAG: LPS export ABC transporter permease LptG [Deltaproteobacteria bacterium]|jgi:lipopolysaccharide export system permease protein|nr:LPS export ABC transporter permease LptG [Deltaproteobacteria bacterium]